MSLGDVFTVGLRTPLGLDLQGDGEHLHVKRVVPRGHVAHFNTLQTGSHHNRVLPHGGRTIYVGAMIELVEWNGHVLSGAICMRPMLSFPKPQCDGHVAHGTATWFGQAFNDLRACTERRARAREQDPESSDCFSCARLDTRRRRMRRAQRSRRESRRRTGEMRRRRRRRAKRSRRRRASSDQGTSQLSDIGGVPVNIRTFLRTFFLAPGYILYFQACIERRSARCLSFKIKHYEGLSACLIDNHGD